MRRGTRSIAERDSCRPAASCRSKLNLSFLHAPRGIAQSLQDVLAFQVRIIGKKFLDAAACADLSDDHPNSDAHPADAGFTAHDERVLGNAVQVCHGLTPSLSYFGHCHPNARGGRWGSGRWSIASQTTSPDGG